MTICNGIAVDFITATSDYESNGIFNSGTYEYSVYDQYNDGLDGGASVIFQTRIAGSTSNMAWNILNVCENSFICDHGQENTDDYVLTVPTGQEMRIAYNCPGNMGY